MSQYDVSQRVVVVGNRSVVSANALPVRVNPKGFGNKSVRCQPTRCCRWKCVVEKSVECSRRYFDVGNTSVMCRPTHCWSPKSMQSKCRGTWPMRSLDQILLFSTKLTT